MWHHETSTTVMASADRLWRLFADVDRWGDWNAGIEQIRLLGRFGNGTQFEMKPPGMDPLTSTLTDVREGESFTDVTELDGNRVTVFHGLTPLPDGGTRVTYRAEVTGPDADQIGPMVTEDFDDVLAALKQTAER